MALGVFAGNAWAADPAYDRIVDDVVARYHLPGVAVGVIEDGKVTYTRTVGEAEAGSGKPITSQSIFKIASNSKAMTASVLARLVDQGKLHWDDPVVKYLPDFRMHDPWVTEHMLVRDLLVHNSGLPEGGGDLMLWPEPNHFSREDIVHGLGYIKPAYGFRAGYAYDNLLYVVAGQVAAAAGGAPYETLVQREIFAPLHLSRCRVGAFDRDATGNVAQPHVRGEDGRYKVGDNTDAVHVEPIASAPAGGIRCSLDDMLAWMGNWLAPTEAQKPWLSAEQRKQMWLARTPMPVSARRKRWDNTHVYAYGYGFRMADVDGQWTVSHTGTLSGMYSMMMLLPDKRSGFVFMINGDADDARTVLGETLLKQFTAPQQHATVKQYADELDAEAKAAAAASKPAKKAEVARKPVVAPFDATRTGTWRDPWFGVVRVCPAGDRLTFVSDKSPLMHGTIVKVGDRWRIDWDEDRMDLEAWVDFKGDGVARRMTLAKVDPDGDFSSDYEDLAFERTGECPAR
nr:MULTISPECIES: serine hydrolase [Lysobacter]